MLATSVREDLTPGFGPGTRLKVYVRDAEDAAAKEARRVLRERRKDEWSTKYDAWKDEVQDKWDAFKQKLKS